MQQLYDALSRYAHFDATNHRNCALCKTNEYGIDV